MTEPQKRSLPVLEQLAKLARLERWYMIDRNVPTTALYIELCKVLDEHSPGWDDGSVNEPKEGVS